MLITIPMTLFQLLWFWFLVILSIALFLALLYVHFKPRDYEDCTIVGTDDDSEKSRRLK